MLTEEQEKWLLAGLVAIFLKALFTAISLVFKVAWWGIRAIVALVSRSPNPGAIPVFPG